MCKFETSRILLDIYFRNLPFGWRATWVSRVRHPREAGARSRHQRLFEENVEKTKTCGLRTLSVKGSGVVFTHGEGISTPRIRHKRQQPLIECARHDFKIMYFPFFKFFSILWAFLYFLSFCGRQGCFPRSYVSSMAMRKSDLRSSSVRSERWLSCFDLFPQDRF